MTGETPEPPSRDQPAQQPTSERTRKTAIEARQGEIILGRYGRWIWIASFALLVLLAIVLMFR